METEGHIQFFLSPEDTLIGGSNIMVESFALGSQSDAAAGPDEKPAAKFAFQILHASCDRGLAGEQDRGGAGKVFVLGDIIKNAVIIETGGQKNASFPKKWTKD